MEKLNAHELWRLRELVLAERYEDVGLTKEKPLDKDYRKELKVLEKKLVSMRFLALGDRTHDLCD